MTKKAIPKKPRNKPKKSAIKHAGSPYHDQTLTKTCEYCKGKYHPLDNGYAPMQSFCDAACARQARRFSPFY